MHNSFASGNALFFSSGASSLVAGCLRFLASRFDVGAVLLMVREVRQLTVFRAVSHCLAWTVLKPYVTFPAFAA